MRIHVPVHVRWGDLDAYNHVNNVEILRLLEEARVRAFWAPERADERRIDTAVFEPGGDEQMLISNHRIEYVRPIEYRRAPMDVQIWFTRLAGASASVAYELHDQESTAPYIRATSTMVFFNAKAGRPRRMTERERAAWTPYLGDPVEFSSRF